ncbi:MAG: hypothetical protein KF729_03985 [Sandaracinaceae bacterium]|nr:hypothetical protein [Sandaracinaceae bacterium]
MISIEYDSDLEEAHRAVLDEALRRLIPTCDPDGRGRLEVRVGRNAGAYTQVEIDCRVPRVGAVVVDPDPRVALERAFARLRDAVAAAAPQPGDLPTSWRPNFSIR